MCFQAADIWSLGVTLFSIVVGRVPFHDENILALYSKIKTQPLEFPPTSTNSPPAPDMSPEVRDLVTKMLIKDPAKRITLEEIKVSNAIEFILRHLGMVPRLLYFVAFYTEMYSGT